MKLPKRLDCRGRDSHDGAGLSSCTDRTYLYYERKTSEMKRLVLQVSLVQINEHRDKAKVCFIIGIYVALSLF